MIEITLVILAAVSTIVVAGFLVKAQNKSQKNLEGLFLENKDTVENIQQDISIITSEPSVEQSLANIERRLDIFSESIKRIEAPEYQERRRCNAKRKAKKHPSDD